MTYTVCTAYDVMMRICRSSLWAGHVLHLNAYEMVHTPHRFFSFHFGPAQDKQTKQHTRSAETQAK